MRKWCLYVLLCADGTYYTGITTDVDRRFSEHCATTKAISNKGAKALRGKHPLKLEFFCEVGNRSDALKIEYKVKKLSKTAKEKLILGDQSINELS